MATPHQSVALLGSRRRRLPMVRHGEFYICRRPGCSCRDGHRCLQPRLTSARPRDHLFRQVHSKVRTNKPEDDPQLMSTIARYCAYAPTPFVSTVVDNVNVSLSPPLKNPTTNQFILAIDRPDCARNQIRVVLSFSWAISNPPMAPSLYCVPRRHSADARRRRRRVPPRPDRAGGKGPSGSTDRFTLRS